MGNFLRIMLVVVTVVYTLSPIDLFPGPIDDAVMLALSLLIGQTLDWDE